LVGLIRHAETLISLQWYALVLTLRLAVYTLLGKQGQIWEKKFSHPQKYALTHTYENEHHNFMSNDTMFT